MTLHSDLFRNDSIFKSCLVDDAAHITPGSRGAHVAKVQYALLVLDRCLIPAAEMKLGLYGPGTADAVLRYKQRRGIINTRYQTTADNIVGKMTIAALDSEMFRAEARSKAQASR